MLSTAMKLPENTYPLPACWHEPWQKHAAANGLSSFPTREFLKEHKEQVRPFCNWIWRELITNDGYMCDKHDDEACCACQRESVSKVISIGILSLIIRDEDPTLYFVLRRKFRQMTRYDPPVKTAPSPDAPDHPPEPHTPLAVKLPVPKHWVHTNAVAQELRHYRYWLQET